MQLKNYEDLDKYFYWLKSSPNEQSCYRSNVKVTFGAYLVVGNFVRNLFKQAYCNKNRDIYTGRIKALLLRHKTTAAATKAAWLRQPLRPATAAAAIEKAQ